MGVTKVIIGGVTKIDISDTTATPARVLAGDYFYDDKGEKQEGTCSYDSNTTDATAVASEILASRTAYVNTNKITGSMPNNGAVSGTIATKDGVYTVPIGFHDGSGTVQLATVEKNKLIPNNIKSGVVLFGITGDYSGEGATAQVKTVTPTMSQQTILPDSGYDYLSQVTVNAIPVTETQTAHGITITVG